MEVRPVGPAALLLDLGAVGAAGDMPEAGAPGMAAAGELGAPASGALDVTAVVDAWRTELWRRRAAGEFVAADIVPGARTVLVDGVPDPAGLARQIAGWPPPAPAGSAGAGLVEIPVRYDGPDLDSVAGCWGVAPEEVVARHLATEFRVAFCGFAPGFAYMTGLDAAVPRLASPRARVPAGSVGLADVYCGIYPTASPGGWRLIGRTGVTLFDPGRAEPALLTPGTRVRFTRVPA